MKSRAFSLIEVAVASAIAGMISAAAVASFAMINRQIVRMQSESLASDHAKSLVDLLVSELQGVGGGPIRPWMAVWVEDGNAGDAFGRDPLFPAPPPLPVKPDRITYATLVPDAATCPILAHGGTSITSNGAGCCLEDLVTAGKLAGVDAAHAFMVLGERHVQVTVSGVNVGPCTATIAPGPMAPVDRPPVGGNFTNGVIAPARVQTLYVTAGRELRIYEEQNGDGVLGVAETRRLAGSVADFQIQLGHDRENDGRLVDTSDGGDEWLYNFDGFEDPTDPRFRPEDLRMIGVGAIVGLPVTDPDYRSEAQIVGGPRVDGIRMHLRGAMGRAALRNIFVFF